MSAYFLRRLRKFGLNDAAATGLDATVSDWISRVVTNGGAAPSSTTIIAVNTFIVALRAAGLYSKMVAVNCFVPDNLTAAITPLIKVSGNDPWTNTGFVSTDLSLFGLTGNGTSKSLDIGVNPFNTVAGGSGGMTLYTDTFSNGSEQDMGSFDGSNSFQFHISFTGSTICDCFNDSSFRISVTNSQWYGYTSMNRTSLTSFNVYKASSSTSHQSIGTNVSSNTNMPPNKTIFCFARNANGTASTWSTKRIQFAAVHAGLSSTESNNFYLAISALQAAMRAGTGAYHPIVEDWANRVVINGGAAPTANTKSALHNFVTRLDTKGLTPLMVLLNPFVPDSLIATITPLIKRGGIDPWTNNNFVVGDLTVNGLKGNGSNKNLVTGYNPNVTMGNTAAQVVSAGMTVYITTSSNGAEQEMGCYNAGPAFQLHVSNGGNTICDCWNDSTFRINVANSLWTGYLSMNRTTASAFAVYKASSSVAHTSIGTNTNANNSAPPPNNIVVFSGNSGSFFAFSTKRISLAAVHMGLSQAQSSDFYDAIQQLRTELGGGFI